jgi:hypothetical protein
MLWQQLEDDLELLVFLLKEVHDVLETVDDSIRIFAIGVDVEVNRREGFKPCQQMSGTHLG